MVDVGEAAVDVAEAVEVLRTDRVEVVALIEEVAMIEEVNEEVVLRIDEVVMTMVTEEVLKIDEVVMMMEDPGEEDLVTTEEVMEAEEEVAVMKIEEEVETSQEATLILADAIEEIQTGDLLLKMILERPPQRRQRPDLSLNCYRER